MRNHEVLIQIPHLPPAPENRQDDDEVQVNPLGQDLVAADLPLLVDGSTGRGGYIPGYILTHTVRIQLFKPSMCMILFFMGIVPYVEDDIVTNTLVQARLTRCTVAEIWNNPPGATHKMHWKMVWKWSPQHTSNITLHRNGCNAFRIWFPYGYHTDHNNLDDVVADLHDFTKLSAGQLLRDARNGAGDTAGPAAGGGAAVGGGPAAGGLQQPFMQAKTNHALLTDIICSLHSRVTRLQNQHGLKYKKDI